MFGLPGRDRNMARLALGREFSTRTLSVVRRVPNSTITYVSLRAGSRKPPYDPGRSDFPNPVLTLAYPPTAFPYSRKLKC